jgi:hypothetical protein
VTEPSAALPLVLRTPPLRSAGEIVERLLGEVLRGWSESASIKARDYVAHMSVVHFALPRPRWRRWRQAVEQVAAPARRCRHVASDPRRVPTSFCRRDSRRAPACRARPPRSSAPGSSCCPPQAHSMCWRHPEPRAAPMTLESVFDSPGAVTRVPTSSPAGSCPQAGSFTMSQFSRTGAPIGSQRSIPTVTNAPLRYLFVEGPPWIGWRCRCMLGSGAACPRSCAMW